MSERGLTLDNRTGGPEMDFPLLGKAGTGLASIARE
jgi:hypothetical protein